MSDFQNVPDELRQYRQWCVWRFEFRKDKKTGKRKRTKIPKSPDGQRNLEWSKRENWLTFDDAVRAYRDSLNSHNPLSGIGFIFSDEDPYFGLDLDDCIAEDGTLSREAQVALAAIESYAEISPSGRGIKIWAKGHPPVTGNWGACHCECYESGRFFTVTGNRYEFAPPTIEHAHIELIALALQIHDPDCAKIKVVNDQTHSLERGLLWTPPEFLRMSRDEVLALKPSHWTQPKEYSRDEILDALQRLPADDYQDEWLSVGMALHAYEPSDAMLSEWITWSRQSDKFEDGACEAKWKTFNGDRPGGVTVGTIIHRAKSRGWRSDGRSASREAVAVADQIKADSTLRVEHAETHNDVANARRFKAANQERARFVHQWRKWLTWDGTRWRVDDDGAAIRLGKAVADALIIEATNILVKAGDEVSEKRHNHAVRFAFKSSQKKGVSDMLMLAQSELPVTVEQLDQNGWLLNVANGTIDLRTGRLREHRREDHLTKVCPVAFDPDADQTAWLKFLNDVFGEDQEIIGFMQRLLGYSITGDVSEHVLPILHGDGANGKSTLVGAINSTLGTDFAGIAPRSLLMAQKGERHPTELATLFGKRVMVASETEDGGELNEALIKQLTGGDRISARRCREDFWEFDATHQLILCTNHKPTVKGTDHAIWRRLKLIPFNRRFEGDQIDPTMPEKLAAQKPGILRWLVDGAVQWQQDGLNEPDAVRIATAEYRTNEDILGQFIEEHFNNDPDGEVKASTFYADLREWCDQQGHSFNRKAKTVTQLMQKRGYSTRTSNGLIYCGLRRQ